MSLRSGSLRTVAATVGLVMLATTVATADGAPPVVRPVTATVGAERGEQTVIDPPPPAPAACRRVAVLGDSLMDNARWYLQRELGAAGFDGVVEAHHSRRISASVPAPYSGVTAARGLRASRGEFDCWVVALGSNDLLHQAGQTAIARGLIDQQLAALTPGARVWWVNLNYRRDPAVSFDFSAATSGFNAALSALATTDSLVTVIDWYSLSTANPGWFFDPVHVGSIGSSARARQAIGALPR